MKNFFLSSITTSPRGSRSLAAQLGYCFVVILVVLIVVSMTISTAYSAVLQQDHTDSLQTTAAVSALSLSHATLQEGMDFPIPVASYFSAGFTKNFTVNVYTKAGNSFLRVYTSAPSESVTTDQVTLEGAGEEYRKAFDQQEAVVVSRSDDSGRYVAGVSPILGVDGTVSGLVEVLMPESDFSATQNGLSLSWVFTMISIAVALSIIYFEINRLLTTMFGQPDRQLPKIIRYGLSGCQSIAFFSAMACSIPPLVISSYLISAEKAGKLPPSIPSSFFIMLGGILLSVGFFGFSSLRRFIVRRFTTRISLVISIFTAFFLLVMSSVFSNVYLYLVLLLPIGFCLGMVFYFQREYRIYASRLGYEEFSERLIHMTQYTGYLLGACVGSVLAGIIFERFGLLAVSIICGCILLIVGIQALLFVQHCPPSSSMPLHLPNLLYALTSRKSGSFVWSSVATCGIQIAFYFVFLPSFLNMVGLSLATISFYFILFSFIGSVVVHSLLKLFPNMINMQGRILISAILQVAGMLILAFIPTAKILVITVFLMGAALGLHEFHFLDFYRDMLRDDKKALAREILERGLAAGVILGSAGYSALFLADNIRLALILFTVVLAVFLFAYPLITLLYAPTKPNPPEHMDDHPGHVPNDHEPYAQHKDPYMYGRNSYEPYNQDRREGGSHQ